MRRHRKTHLVNLRPGIPKAAALVLALLLILSVLPVTGRSDPNADMLSLDPVRGVIRPGGAVLIGFDVPCEGRVSLTLRERAEAETPLSVIALDLPVTAGRNGIWWNGTYAGVPAPAGDWVLVLEMDGARVTTEVTIGENMPMMTDIAVSSEVLMPGSEVTVSLTLTCPGTLKLSLDGEGERTYALLSGTQELLLDGSGVTAGTHTLLLELTDAQGVAVTAAGPVVHVLKEADDETEDLSERAENPLIEHTILDEVLLENEEQLLSEALRAEETSVLQDTAVPAGQMDQSQYTPSYASPYGWTQDEGSYWTTPMDITDEEAVWQMLTKAVTVVDTGRKHAEKTQVVLLSEPREGAAGVGVVTCVTQGVRVLENLDNGYSLIECYSASFHDSKVKAWNLLVQGYVKTSLLKTVEPDQEIGLVVDKLTQRLYIFREGRLFSTLLVSTGLANARQPYNETRSGEFLLQVPAVGEFRSDNLYCSMGIRFDDGDLLHEVPHLKNKDGTKNYSTTEYKLGTRASHGCIRVQRHPTPEGTNMLWIWKNKKKNMKLVIWEDWQGRQIAYPDEDTVVYRAAKGKYYHRESACPYAKNAVFTPLRYAELDDAAHASLQRCAYCNPPMRREEIDAINLLHAPGGDHDPILTEARKKQTAR